jgi:hypothetical protein
MSVKSIVSVNGLQQLGYSVKVRHYRRYRRYEGGKIHFDLLPNSIADPKYSLPTGGKIEIAVIDKDGNEFPGISRCKDNEVFNKKLGVQLALTQAIRGLLLSKTAPETV